MNQPPHSTAERKTGTPGSTKRRPKSAERMQLHALFNKWATHPYEDCLYLALRMAMRAHELKSRLLKQLPPLPSTPCLAASDDTNEPNQN